MKYYLSLWAALSLYLLGCAQETRPNDILIAPNTSYTYETIVPELINPWGLAFLPDGSMLITEKSGDIIHFKDGEKRAIKGAPEVFTRNQAGLMDVALHPNYASNAWIYFTYSSPEGEGQGANTALMRAQLKGDELINKEVLYKATPNTRSTRHFGSRIAFDANNYVYFSIGDRADRDINPQDITLDGGKIYRLHDDGTIPKDNPFVKEDNAKKAIYSYGHRNPQGMVAHPKTGTIWVHEHGPRGGDEINAITSGKNYGWPIISYGINYSGTKFTDITQKDGMQQPIYYWVPSIAPCGMAFGNDAKYDEFNGNIFAGSLKFQYLERLILENDQVVRREKLLENIGRVRNVVMGPDGYVYVGVEGKGILKLVKS